MQKYCAYGPIDKLERYREGGELVYLAADVDARIAELERQTQRLKAALDFWLPQVPIEGNEEIIKRIGNDADMLFDCNHDLDQCAEDLGWITLNATAQGKLSGDSNG